MEGKQLRERLVSLFGPLSEEKFQHLQPVIQSGGVCWVYSRPRYERICFRETTKTWEYNASYHYHGDNVRIQASVTPSPEQNARIKDALLCDKGVSTGTWAQCIASAFPNAQVEVDFIGKI
jgi:hypothetical protein